MRVAYAVTITESARRQLNHIPNPFRGNIERHIDALSEGPRPPNAIPLKADPGRRWRLRVGDWRVLYVIDDRMRAILVTDVLPRGKAYRNL